ncbi:MAG: tautomerase family protein [Actinomycetota bacterium]
MPLYRTVVRPGLTDVDVRQAFAGDVVDVHCGVTGAPPSLVHVLYVEDDARLPDGTDAVVLGTIRSGRSGDQKERITAGLTDALAERAGIPVEAITVRLADIPASYAMEDGVILPEPGSPEEEAFKAGVNA